MKNDYVLHSAVSAQASFQDTLQQALGGARVQVEPARRFYPAVVSTLVQQYLGRAQPVWG